MANESDKRRLRWNGDGQAASPKVDAFLDDIFAVYAKHGMSIGHSGYGEFEIEEDSKDNRDLLDAADIAKVQPSETHLAYLARAEAEDKVQKERLAKEESERQRENSVWFKEVFGD